MLISYLPLGASQIQESSLIFGKLIGMYKGLIKSLPKLGIALLIVLFTWGLARLSTRLVGWGLRHTRVSGPLRELLTRISYAIAWTLGVFVAATVIFPSLTPGKFLAAFGVGSVAIGFAFKDIFQNFFAGFMILWRFPFNIGDFILHKETLGKVEEITIRNTLLRTPTGHLVIVPNASLLNDEVEVLTQLNRQRLSVICGISYNDDIEDARDAIYATMKELRTVKQEQPIQVFLHELGASSVNFEITWWAGPTPLDRRRSIDEVITATKYTLDERGIVIPFPQRTLTFDAPLMVSKQQQSQKQGQISPKELPEPRPGSQDKRDISFPKHRQPHEPGPRKPGRQSAHHDLKGDEAVDKARKDDAYTQLSGAEGGAYDHEDSVHHEEAQKQREREKKEREEKEKEQTEEE